MRSSSCAACRQRRRSGGIGAIRAIASFRCDDGECRGVCAKRCDLERDDCGALELPLECVVPARSAVVTASRSRIAKRIEGVLPCLCVRVGEGRCASLERERLGRDSARFVPVLRAPRDHRHESRGERDRERGGRASARRFRSGGEPVQERAQPQIEVVLGVQEQDESTATVSAFLDFAFVPLYLTESDVSSLLEPADAVEVIEECFQRMARGVVENAPRRRLQLEEGSLADMAASDRELGVAGAKLYTASPVGATFVVCLFDAEKSELAAVIEADQLGRLRTGAASGVAARYLARQGARTLGVLGCGHQAETQVACIRAALPSIERVVAYCRTPERLDSFCRRVDADAGESHRDSGAQDIVVTMTNSPDPVLRGEWLAPGALVIAAGANVASRRELDNTVLERASFVCCDSLETARLESGDLIEPVQAGVLDWLEVHEFHEVVSGEVAGRQSDADVVVFKSNGIAAWDVALGAEALRRAREQGVGTSV